MPKEAINPNCCSIILQGQLPLVDCARISVVEPPPDKRSFQKFGFFEDMFQILLLEDTSFHVD